MLRLPYLVLALAVGIAPIEAALKCKCLPGQSCFPSEAVLSTFEKKLTHPLVHPKPIADVCFVDNPSFSSAACSTVKSNWNNGAFRASIPNALQFTNWESIINSTVIEQCDPFGDVTSQTDVCFQARVPWGVVNATTISDIQNAVKFGSQHNLKLVVKNTGHESLGRSFGESSLMIWTHNMQNVSFSESFIPQGSPNGTKAVSTVTVGPGVQWGDLYAQAATNGKVVVGGIGAGGTVGAGGGWPMGGGHSILSPFYGVDNIVQETVVLPNGTHVTANLFTNPDLFWALRGGGGPSFGILTSVTYLTHPSEPVTAAFLASNTTTEEGRLALFTEWVKAQPALVDAGWAGFWPYSGTQFFLTLMALGSPPTNPNANSTLQSFYDTIAKIPGVQIGLQVTKTYTGFEQWYDDNFIHSQNGIGFNYTVGDFSGVPVAVASRLIPRENFENEPEVLAQALTALDDARPFLVGGGAVANVNPDIASVNPAFRIMLSDLTIALSWDATTATFQDIQNVRQNVTNLANGVRKVTPKGGAYVNEPDILEPNWQTSYWGDHYPRLLAFKKTLDPQDVLIVRQGVNSEAWDDEILCKTL